MLVRLCKQVSDVRGSQFWPLISKSEKDTGVTVNLAAAPEVAKTLPSSEEEESRAAMRGGTTTVFVESPDPEISAPPI